MNQKRKAKANANNSYTAELKSLNDNKRNEFGFPYFYGINQCSYFFRSCFYEKNNCVC